jgi:predicted GIY-YIG superfamily endonuclease
MATERKPGWFVYILECSDRTLYTGVATDVEKRLAEHSAGRGAKYTRTRLPVKLVFSEGADDRSAALRREYAIKQLRSAAKHRLIQTTSCEPIVRKERPD